jgi:hypothetical protein
MLAVLVAVATGACVAGCAAPTAERPAVGLFEQGAPLVDTPRITLAEPELEGVLTFGAGERERTDNGALSIRVPVTNAGPYRYAIGYAVQFYDAEGRPLNEPDAAVRLRLSPGETRVMRGNSAGSPADDYRIHIDWAD